MKLKYICFILATAALLSCFQPARARKYDSVEGLVLAGYQGWFNAVGDGAQLGWKHYQKDGEFRPGMCSIDLWPEVSEYGKTYSTAFSFPDGSAAEVFSSHDRSTTMLHFSWMRQYGIDGVFMQRFIASLRTGKGKANYNDILLNALDASDEYGRAICVMYDLSGISSEETQMLLDDWKELTEKYRITSRANYLHQNGKPLVAVWGAGFDDGRRYGLDDVERIVDFLKEEGCAVLLGVPAHWRTLSMDAVSDPKLLEIIDKADIVHPWFVGRFNYDSCDRFLGLMEQDLEWCREHGKIYMPVVFPGFNWYNLKDGVAAPLNSIPRLGGKFFWKQVCNVLSVGAETMYIAMFDEMDEGTAIFKCANKVPVGESPFLSYEGYETDRYLWLAGMAGKALRGEIEATVRMPERPSAPVKEPVDYVNPNMGGISHLLVPTYPTVHLPNGMMRVYPQRENFAADLVNGLPFIVTSHRGKSAFNLSFGQGADRETAPCYKYRCDNEKIKPYLYTVYFEEEEVSARYAPSYHSGIYELHFDRDEAPYLIMNTSSGDLRYDDGRLYGSNSIDGKTGVYLCAVFSVKPSGIETVGNGDGEYIVLRFPSGTAEIGLRYGVSFIDENQAEANLDGEIKDFNLDSVARKGRDIWNRQLGLIRVEGSDEDAKTVFYTSLYRICERMVCLTEGDRYFSAYDGKVHTDTIPFYTDDWVWDTYHAAHPLRVLVEPEKETDMLRSYIRMAEQLDPQWMPTFPEVTGDSRRMNCNHSGAAGTAYATGHKTHNGAIGVDINDKPLKNIPEIIDGLGYVSGVITTDGIDGCTPSVFFAHQPERHMSEEIWGDLADARLSFIAGGSHNAFENQEYETRDAIEKRYKVVSSLDEIPDKAKRVAYLPEKEEVCSIADGRGDFLPATTEYAIEFLDSHPENEKGFFLMVEGARIDKSCHNNDFGTAVLEVLDFDKAVEAAVRFAEKDGNTLVIITADHETGALSLRGKDNKSGKIKGLFASRGHTPIMVPLFAYGPMSLEFAGVQENTDVNHKIVNLLSSAAKDKRKKRD